MDIIKKMAKDAIDSASPLQFYEATVMTEPPNISIRLRGNTNLVIPREIISVASHLKLHKHQVTIPARTYTAESAGSHSHTSTGTTNSSGAHTHSVRGTTGEEEGHSHSIDATTDNNGSHSHSFSSSTNSTGSHTHTVPSPVRTIETHEQDDRLKKGDHIMVAALQGGQSFFVLDRITRW